MAWKLAERRRPKSTLAQKWVALLSLVVLALGLSNLGRLGVALHYDALLPGLPTTVPLVYLAVNLESHCVFTRGIDRVYLPVAHAEGKVVAADDVPSKNVVLRYTDEQGNLGAGYPCNPNGSVADIAGMCDDTGRVFALMPHPERFIRGTQHPRWTRHGAAEQGDGLRIFQNAVKWAAGL